MTDRHVHILATAARQTQRRLDDDDAAEGTPSAASTERRQDLKTRRHARERASWPPGARRAATQARVDENRWIDEGGSLGWTRQVLPAQRPAPRQPSGHGKRDATSGSAAGSGSARG
jgi:hypothetical protein